MTLPKNYAIIETTTKDKAGRPHTMRGAITMTNFENTISKLKADSDTLYKVKALIYRGGGTLMKEST